MGLALSSFAKAGLYLHTLRYLRPVQLYGRAFYQLFPAKVDASSAPTLRHISGVWIRPAERLPSVLGPGVFRFLSVSGHLVQDGWDNPARDKLWRYNQHYFDDLNAQGGADRNDWQRELVTNWMNANPPGKGTGWEPYPTSLRIINWVKWANSGEELPQDVNQSLAVQTRFLRKRLEWHLLGNHLLANAKALVYAGLFFEGVEAKSWLKKGLRILRRELPEQFLADGGQFELSPMYHSLALEDILDLINIFRLHQGSISSEHLLQLEAWEMLVPKMLAWLNAMCHPDGEIAFFNDAATGIAPCPQELFAYAKRLGFEKPSRCSSITLLPESGYVRLNDDAAVLIADVARIGPDYLPGHAHADTLSFELSLCGQRVFVNSGTSIYGLDAERLRQRGTSAHNTVLVDEENSSEVWSGFRVARRAYPHDVRIHESEEAFFLVASHDGYKRLKGKPEHTRTWKLSPNRLQILDRVSGHFSDAQARFHIHPDVKVDASDDNSGVLVLATGQRISWRADGGTVVLENTTWHPEFGVSVPNKCIVLRLRDGAATLELWWD